jgi:hypothetical protein
MGDWGIEKVFKCSTCLRRGVYGVNISASEGRDEVKPAMLEVGKLLKGRE